MFNPVPHVVYAFLCLACGIDACAAPEMSGVPRICPGGNGELPEMSGVRPWLLRGAAALALALLSLRLIGDACARRGEVSRLAGDRVEAVSWYLAAGRLNPFEPLYPLLAAREAATGQPGPLLGRVERACLRSLRLHGRHPLAVQAAALALKLSGRTREARTVRAAGRGLDGLARAAAR